MLIIGMVFIVISLSALAWGVRTEFLQSRDTGPIAREPTLFFAVQPAMLFTMGLFFARKSSVLGLLPWWACIGAGVIFSIAGVGLITAAGHIGQACRN
jgi:hypothetical protein